MANEGETGIQPWHYCNAYKRAALCTHVHIGSYNFFVVVYKALASNLLGRAKDLASNEDLGYEVCFQLNLMLAHVHAKHACHLLSTPQANGTLDSGEAIGLLNAANEIIGNMTSDDEDPAVDDKIMAANQLSAQVCCATHNLTDGCIARLCIPGCSQYCKKTRCHNSCSALNTHTLIMA